MSIRALSASSTMPASSASACRWSATGWTTPSRSSWRARAWAICPSWPTGCCRPGRRWKLETPWSRPDCASANCKCGQLAGQQAAGKRVLYVGDGSSDFCVSGKAEHVLAKAKLLDHCRANGIVHSAFVDFDEALSRLPLILSGQNEESTA